MKESGILIFTSAKGVIEDPYNSGNIAYALSKQSVNNLSKCLVFFNLNLINYLSVFNIGKLFRNASE